MTLELAWNPRWAVIMAVNSWARSTFDISTVPDWIAPRPFCPAAPQEATPAAGVPELFELVESYTPEFGDDAHRLSPMRVMPAGFGNLAMATRPAICCAPAASV